VTVPDHDFRLHPPAARLLEGRRALVTGATGGIGQGTAFALAAPGAAVAINHRGKVEEARTMAATIEAVSDVADAVAWAASEHAGYVVGATIFVDGGMTLYPNFV
jgi:glucose 1-dehydrogenase